jgi:glycosyltransferase involved in cell wall biosynthesis
MEAAAAGAPTIAPSVGGLPETIRDGENGLLYRFLDVKDLERQMRRVLEEPGLLRHLIANVRRPADTSHMGAILEAFYLNAIEKGRRKSYRPVAGRWPSE